MGGFGLLSEKAYGKDNNIEATQSCQGVLNECGMTLDISGLKNTGVHGNPKTDPQVGLNAVEFRLIARAQEELVPLSGKCDCDGSGNCRSGS